MQPEQIIALIDRVVATPFLELPSAIADFTWSYEKVGTSAIGRLLAPVRLIPPQLSQQRALRRGRQHIGPSCSSTSSNWWPSMWRQEPMCA